MLRTFVAIELPPPVRATLQELLARMRKEFPKERLRWPPPENVHLTLKFLGATPESEIPNILKALEQSLSNLPRFSLLPKGIGAFPPRGAPRVVWIGFEGEIERLLETAETVEKTLNPLGFPRENRPFSPHLTIARAPRNRPKGRASLVPDLLAKFEAPLFPTFEVQKATLMESKLGHPHSVYTPLGVAPLRRTC